MAVYEALGRDKGVIKQLRHSLRFQSGCHLEYTPLNTHISMHTIKDMNE